MRRGKTGRNLGTEAGNKEIRKGSLGLSLNMRREKLKPDAQREIVVKSMERGNEATIILGMLNHAIPPSRKIANGNGVEDRKILLELFLVLRVEALTRHVGEKEFTIHVESRNTNRMVNQDIVIRAGGSPRDNGAGGGIDDHVGVIMNVALKVLPSRTLAKGRKDRATCKERRETNRVGEAGALIGIPGGSRSRIGRIGSGRQRDTGSIARRTRRTDRRRDKARREHESRKRTRSRRNGERKTTEIAIGGQRIRTMARKRGNARNGGRVAKEDSRRGRRGNAETHGATKRRRKGQATSGRR
jgi:hypothetical protein